MFILPYLRKRKALQGGPRLAYAGASASGLAEVPAEAESDDFYEDAYGNRYRAEELPGFLEESTGEEDPAVYQPLPPASQGQQYLEEGPFAEELPYQSYQDNSEFAPVSYYDMEPYGDSQAPLYPDASGSGNESRDIYSGREFAAPDSRPYDDGNIKYSSFRNYDPLERHRHSRDWDRYFNDIDKRY